MNFFLANERRVSEVGRPCGALVVYADHGPETTIGREKKKNPFVKEK